MTNEKKVLKKEQKTLETLLKDNLDNSENLSSASVIEELSQAMKINANGVFEKSGFDRDKARAYCWQSVGYQGEKKSKFGFLEKNRNLVFENNVNRAIAIFWARLQVGETEFQSEYLEFRNGVGDKSSYLAKVDHIIKMNNKEPDAKIKLEQRKRLPLTDIIPFCDYAVSGKAKPTRTKSENQDPIYDNVVENAVSEFQIALLKDQGFFITDEKGQVIQFKYETFIDKFNDNVLKSLKLAKQFISFLEECNQIANELHTEDGKAIPNSKDEIEKARLHIVELNKYSAMKTTDRKVA